MSGGTQRPTTHRHRLPSLFSQARVRDDRTFAVNVTLATDKRGELVGIVIWGDDSTERSDIGFPVEQARVLLDLLDGYMK